MASKRPKGGRYTPKGGGTGSPRPASAPTPPPQVGRRPSPPSFLFVVAALWILAGIGILVFATFSLKLVFGVFAIGVGLFFLRGAAQTVVRRDERTGSGSG